MYGVTERTDDLLRVIYEHLILDGFLKHRAAEIVTNSFNIELITIIHLIDKQQRKRDDLKPPLINWLGQTTETQTTTIYQVWLESISYLFDCLPFDSLLIAFDVGKLDQT